MDSGAVPQTLLEQLGIALLLGGLVGLQRQHVEATLGGVRTFALTTVFGTVCAALAVDFGPWVVAAGLICVVATIVVGNIESRRLQAETDPGITTEIAMLLMFAVGALLASGSTLVAIVVGAGVAVLLSLKPQLHGFIARLGDSDVRAIMQFVLITFIVLPVLPDRTYGPLDVLNPHEIWLMVVLVVGISLGAYISYKLLGQRSGLLLSGLLGGLISSTVTTTSYARRTTESPEIVPVGIAVIMMASTVSLVRVMTEMGIVAPRLLLSAAWPMGVLFLASTVLSVIACVRYWRHPEPMPLQENPSELKSALVFGALYGGVLLGIAAAREFLPHAGLYVVAVLSGLTDLDAITLSTSQLVQANRLNAATAWRLILVACLSNLSFKLGIVAVLGHRRLLKQVGWMFGVLLVVGMTLVLVVPDSE